MEATVISPAEQEEIAAFRRVEGILDACGPEGIRKKICKSVRGETDATPLNIVAENMGDILDALGGTESRLRHPVYLSEVLETVIPFAGNYTGIKNALLPRLPRFIDNLMDETDSGDFAFGPAHDILESKDTDMIAAIAPHLPKLFDKTTWSSHNFGILACAWLDAGQNPKEIYPSLDMVLNRPYDAWTLARSVCNTGFIQFLNNPRVKEDKGLHARIRFLKGSILKSPHYRDLDATILCGVFNRTADTKEVISLIAYQPRQYTPADLIHPDQTAHMVSDFQGTYFPRALHLASNHFKKIRNAANNGPVRDAAVAAMQALQVAAPGR